MDSNNQELISLHLYCNIPAVENNDGEMNHIKDMCCVVAVSLLSSRF